MFKLILMIELIKKELTRRLDKLERENGQIPNFSHQVRDFSLSY